MVRLTKVQSEALDRSVLNAAAEWSPSPTYVLRNRIARTNGKRGLKTASVLRSCRRLEKAGLLQQYRGSGYAVMLVWELTPAGRQALEAHHEQ